MLFATPRPALSLFGDAAVRHSKARGECAGGFLGSADGFRRLVQYTYTCPFRLTCARSAAPTRSRASCVFQKPTLVVSVPCL
eukprot:5409972-Pyramimonas_sp.AAC.1